MKQCHVYVIRCADTDRHKIGISNDPASRLHDLQVGCPFPLGLAFCSLPVSRMAAAEIEKAAHTVFEMLSVGREWFRLPPDFAPSALNTIMQVCGMPQSERVAAIQRLHDYVEDCMIEGLL